MDIDEWSQDSQAFKTITSGSQTRNQTTNKKQYQKNTRSSPKSRIRSLPNEQSIQQLYRELERLQNKRVKQIHKNKYDKLENINKKISLTKQKINRLEQRVTKSMFEQKQFAIYEQHEQQMKYFHELWDDIFQRFKRNEQVSHVKLQVEEQREVRELYQRLEAKKQAIVKRVSRNKELISMKKVEGDLIKKNKFQELAKLKLPSKRRQIKKQIRQRTMQQISNLQQQQLWKLQQKYEKKQSCLKMKLKQCREYEQKVFNKNKQKLKQKFMNSINKLQHNQKIIKNRCFSNHK